MTDSTTPTSVYKYYDKRDMLIYVGITSRAMKRNTEHNLTKQWWPHVVRQDVEHYPTRARALAQEKRLIQKHLPPFNKQHNPSHAELVRVYERFAEAEVAYPNSVDILNETKARIPLDLVSYDEIQKEAHFVSREEHFRVGRILRKVGEVPAFSYKRAGRVERIIHSGLNVHVYIRGKHVHEARRAYAFVHRGPKGLRFDRAFLITDSSPESAFGIETQSVS